MKTRPLIVLTLLVLGAGMPLHSQWQQSPASALQQLQTLKAKNQQLLERQTATLQKLDELELQAQQVKFLGKRS